MRCGDTFILTVLPQWTKAWLEVQGDLTTAAHRLEVHPNTVRYRIRKMHEITTLHLDDPDKRLAMLITLAVDAQDLTSNRPQRP